MGFLAVAEFFVATWGVAYLFYSWKGSEGWTAIGWFVGFAVWGALISTQVLVRFNAGLLA